MSRRSTGPDKLTVEALVARSRGRCEICGGELRGERGIDWHVHHRRPRGMGSTKRPESNAVYSLLVLCRQHHEQVERRRAAAYVNGWLVRQYADPSAVPVLLPKSVMGEGGPWALLTDDGGYRPVEDVGLPEVIGGH